MSLLKQRKYRLYLIGPLAIVAVILAGFSLIGAGSGGHSTGSSDRYVQGVGVQMGEMYSRLHVGVGFQGEDIDHSTTPPTSGNHWNTPVRCGFYEQAVADEIIVHNLEHSNIVVSYNLATQAEVAQLREAVEGIDLAEAWGVTRFYPDIEPGTVALSAWVILDTMQGVDADRITRFFEAYAGTMGPEGGITCINSAEMP